MLDLLNEADATAVISRCGLYRYHLTRKWGRGPYALLIMLNPSTADAMQDDPTIRRCISFAKREGCGALVVVNLFAFRSPSPADMKAADDPVGPENDRYIRSAVAGAKGPIIAAWGAHGSYRGRDKAVRALVDAPMVCLGLTKAGAPRHPLYVRGDAPLIDF